jgi:hypothetical protein
MKKLFSLLCFFVVLCVVQGAFAIEGRKPNRSQKKQNEIECVQQLNKPSYYQPYNIPGGKKKFAKDYNSDWDIKVDAIKGKKGKNNN